MKVFVVHNDIQEDVISVHRTEAGAHKKIEEEDKRLQAQPNLTRSGRELSWCSYTEHEVEE